MVTKPIMITFIYSLMNGGNKKYFFLIARRAIPKNGTRGTGNRIQGNST